MGLVVGTGVGLGVGTGVGECVADTAEYPVLQVTVHVARWAMTVVQVPITPLSGAKPLRQDHLERTLAIKRAQKNSKEPNERFVKVDYRCTPVVQHASGTR